MSEDIFKKDNKTTQDEAPRNDNSNSGPPQASTHYLDQLVGEGKKFKSYEDLARGKAESDSYIENLKTEIEELKGKLNNSKTVDDLIDKLQQRSTELSKTNTDEGKTNHDSGSDSEIVRLLKEGLPGIVQKELTAAQKVQLEENNKRYVNEAMSKIYGDKASEHLNKRAGELGVGKDFLLETAKVSPKAFLELMDIPMDKLKSATPSSPVTPSQRTEGRPSTSPEPGSWEDCEKIRKENPSLYWSPSFQKKMFEDMKAGKYTS